MWNLRGHPPRRCEQIRERVSLGLDNRLSAFERVVVERHVASCPECRVFAEDVRGFTTALRLAPMESLSRPVVLPATRRPVWNRSLGAAAAAAAAVVAVAVGTASLTASLSDDGLADDVGRAARGSAVDVDMELMRERQYQEFTERMQLTQPRPVREQLP